MYYSREDEFPDCVGQANYPQPSSQKAPADAGVNRFPHLAAIAGSAPCGLRAREK